MTSSDPRGDRTAALLLPGTDPGIARHLRILHDGGVAVADAAVARPDPTMTPVNWLLTEASRHAETRTLIRDLCALLVDRGMPLLRVTCFVRTLHPQASGSNVVWLRERPNPRTVRVLRGMEDTPAFQASPLPLIFQGAAAIRRRPPPHRSPL